MWYVSGNAATETLAQQMHVRITQSNALGEDFLDLIAKRTPQQLGTVAYKAQWSTALGEANETQGLAHSY